MKINKIYSTGALMLLLAGVPGIAMAVVGAMAAGSDGSWGWASRDSQTVANSEALRFCNEHASKKDCKLFSFQAVVRAEGGGRTSYSINRDGIAATKKDALKGCGNKACKVNLVVTDPGFFSLARTQKQEDGSGVYHLAYAFDDSDAADKKAIERCQEESGKECSLIFYGVIPGRIDKPAPKPALARQPSENNCRPTTPTVRCSWQCSNGDCTVTYENGCRMRVQVQPRFDGFQNQWVYPAPSC